MEKIANSSFGKFEGFELSNLQMVKGGKMQECTGGGSHLQGYQTVGGTTYAIADEWNSDSIDANGGTTYNGYTTTWYAI